MSTFKKLKRNVCVAIIVNKNNEFLLQKKSLDYKTLSGGLWCLFGGEINKKENPKNAIRRELNEELGINFTNIKFLYASNYSIKNIYYGKMYVFLIKFNNKILDIKLKEGRGFAFFDYSEINKINIFSDCKKHIRRYMKENTI